MRKTSFLHKLHKEGKLELVEPSEDISVSYIQKTENCLASARLLLTNSLWENSVAMSYYTMYNALQAILYKVGIKCENHTAAISLLKEVFHQEELHKSIAFAKKERIDKQYYITFKLTQESAQDLVTKAEDFLLKIRTLLANLRNDELDACRQKMTELLK